MTRTDPLDNAWRIVRKTVEEAENRYGLTLHGRVSHENHEYTLEFFCEELLQMVRQKVAYDFLQTPEDADVFVEFGTWRAVRKWATERDMRDTANATEDGGDHDAGAGGEG